MTRYLSCVTLSALLLGSASCTEADFPATDEPPPSALPDPGDTGSCASEQERIGWVDGWRWCYPESAPKEVAAYHFVMDIRYTRGGCKIVSDMGPTLAFMSKAVTNSDAGYWTFESYFMGIVTTMVCYHPRRH